VLHCNILSGISPHIARLLRITFLSTVIIYHAGVMPGSLFFWTILTEKDALLCKQGQEELSRRIMEKVPELESLGPRLRWVSPLEDKGFQEYKDKEFLTVIGYECVADALRNFWSLRGQN
jgi:hypothetical protein